MIAVQDKFVVTIVGHVESFDEALIFFAKTVTDNHLVNVSFGMNPEFKPDRTLRHHVQITGYVMRDLEPGALDADIVFEMNNMNPEGESDE